MSHYAKVLNGKVIEVIVAEESFFDTFIDSSPGQWIQTSYNTRFNSHPDNRPLRGNYAGIGYTYDSMNDVFYEPQPYPSWSLNKSTWGWEPPIPRPIDNKYYVWDESSKTWNELI